MARVIKFRGMDENGKWLYGYLSSPNTMGVDISDPSVGHHEFDDYYVNPETVGQFTGLYDKAEKEIYEGDILSVCNGSINGIEWMDAAYAVKYVLNKGWDMPLFLWDKDGGDQSDSTHYCKVIGNIYDNAELLTNKK